MNKKAFTLVELIVVITILAILWTIWFTTYTGYTSEARDSSRLADMWNIKKAIDLNETEQEMKNCAIKKIDGIFDHILFAKRTMRELKILRLLEHQNVSINYIDCRNKRNNDTRKL
mgnify:CR=1 FL=1